MSRLSHPRFLAPALLFALIATGLASPAAAAQSHSSSSGSPTHLRALAVYEYTGSYQKPARSRLVPVAIWDGSQFQPASLYLANPEPLAVQSGTLYELMQDGNGVGQVQVLQAEQLQAEQLQAGEQSTTQGTTQQALTQQGVTWIGLAKYLPNPRSGPKFKVPASLTAKAKFASDQPRFAYKPPATTGVAGAKPTASTSGPPRQGSSAESGRPSLHQRPQISGPATSSAATPADEGRPTLHPSQSSSQSTPPTLHHRTENQQLSNRQTPADSGRPILTYSKNTPSPVTQLQQDALTGLPPQMQQMAAISDASGTTDHSYAWDWPTPGDKTAALRKMQILALESLPPPTLLPPAKPRKPARSPKPIHRIHAASTAPELQLTFTHQHFHAFQLDYGSGPVYVFSAQSGAPGLPTTYLTLIAQPDFAGGLIPLYKSITPANLLDYQPRMRLIDAVDATGSGRADLLFNLITRHSRHFALFRVQNGQAQEVFHTGQQ